jgi:hypothetical protein
MTQNASHRPSGGNTKSTWRFVPTLLTGQLCDVCWDLRDSSAGDMLNTAPIRKVVVNSDENFHTRQFCIETQFVDRWKLLRADVSNVTLTAHAKSTCWGKPDETGVRLQGTYELCSANKKAYQLRPRTSASCANLPHRQVSEPAAQRGTPHTNTHTHTHTQINKYRATIQRLILDIFDHVRLKHVRGIS